MHIILLFAVFFCTALLAWQGQQGFLRQFARYRSRFKQHARSGLAEMFLFLDPAQVWAASLLLYVGVAVLAWLATHSLALAALGGAVVALMPRHVLQRAQRRRLDRLDQQLPDLLLALAGALRAGVGIQSALRHVADHTPPPLCQELGLMLRQQRMGVAFDEALLGLQRRIPTEGVRLLVSALIIASHTGGHLAETLERIAATLRARMQLAGRVRALTAQGRMQAWIMASLPAGLAYVLYGLNPQSMSALWETLPGWAVLALIFTLELVGLLIIRKIVTIDV